MHVPETVLAMAHVAMVFVNATVALQVLHVRLNDVLRIVHILLVNAEPLVVSVVMDTLELTAQRVCSTDTSA